MTNTKTTEEQNEKLEDLISETDDLKSEMESISDELNNVGTCETLRDAKASLRDARDAALALAKAIDKLLTEAG